MVAPSPVVRCHRGITGGWSDNVMSRVIRGDRAARGQRWQPPEFSEATTEEETFVATPYGSKPNRDIDALAIREAAQQEGFREGYEEGQQAARNEIERLREKLEASLDFIANPVAQIDRQVETELLELALAVAKQILRREIKLDPKHLMGLIREAIKQLPSNTQKIMIHLFPDDARMLREMLHDSDHEQHWQIIDDPALKQGDCKIHTDSAFIDASIDALISRLAAEMLGGHRNNDNTPNAAPKRKKVARAKASQTTDDKPS